MKYYLTIDGKASKVLVSTPLNDVEDRYKSKLNELKLHILVQNEQYKVNNQLKMTF